MGNAGDIGKVMAIKAKAAMLGVKATAQRGVMKEDLEAFEKLNEELRKILDTKEQHRNTPGVQSYFSEAESLKANIDNTLKLFKENYHLDKDNYYVDTNGKRS